LREQQQLEELEQGRGEWTAIDNNAGARQHSQRIGGLA
jgi:hypothetical protein